MTILTNISQLATCRPQGAQGDLHIITNAAVAWDGDTISWVGSEKDLPENFKTHPKIDANKRLVIPGLIDCHTHLAFAGSRHDEFEQRILGKGYIDIAKSGGGILSTVKATRSASAKQLLNHCLDITKQMAALGITTVECKSGYGLDIENELKTLRVYRELAQVQPLTIVPTFLGAHMVPPEFARDRENYINLLTNELLPIIAKEKLSNFCDAFVEDSALTLDEARQVLKAANNLGLNIRLHADQLSDGHGAELAAEFGAASADHLECVSEPGIKALAKAGVIGTVLPYSSLFTFQKPLDARRLIDAGVKVAVASNFNPGSAPSFHLPIALTLSCTLNRLTPSEALKGSTIYAAQVLRLDKQIGSVEVGKNADLAIINAQSVNEWLSQIQSNACLTTIKGGTTISS
jgi:imidazolonepropionase